MPITIVEVMQIGVEFAMLNDQVKKLTASLHEAEAEIKQIKKQLEEKK